MGTINGTNLADKLTATFANNIVHGNGGNDTITGLSYNEWLYGDAGNDAINGGGGNDNVFGGDGDDTITVGAGNSNVYGNAGNDTFNITNFGSSFYGGAGNDVFNSNQPYWSSNGGNNIDGGDGYDVINASINSSTIALTSITGVEEINSKYAGVSVSADPFTSSFLNFTGVKFVNITDINGSDQGETIFMEGSMPGANILLSRDDNIHAGGGIDVIDGGYGIDRIYGDAGADWLAGGANKDYLFGGADADRFIYHSVLDSQVGNADEIMDFSSVQGDKVDLSEIDANLLIANWQHFTFIGTTTFSGVGGEIRYETIGSDVHVLGDINGDPSAEIDIVIHNVTSLAATDFLL